MKMKVQTLRYIMQTSKHPAHTLKQSKEGEECTKTSGKYYLSANNKPKKGGEEYSKKKSKGEKCGKKSRRKFDYSLNYKELNCRDIQSFIV